MTHQIYRVVSCEPVAPFRLRVRFDDKTTQVIDFRAVLDGELYGPLQDPEFFSQVQIDVEAHTLIWPNGADFDPAMLHDWPETGSAMRLLAEQWVARKGRAQVGP